MVGVHRWSHQRLHLPSIPKKCENIEVSFLTFLNQHPGTAFHLFNKHFLGIFYVSLCARPQGYKDLYTLGLQGSASGFSFFTEVLQPSQPPSPLPTKCSLHPGISPHIAVPYSTTAFHHHQKPCSFHFLHAFYCRVGHATGDDANGLQ